MRSEVQVLLDPPIIVIELGNNDSMRSLYGALAQLGERLICIQEVRSSILLGSTITNLSAKQFYCLAVQLGDFDIVKRDTNITSCEVDV